MTAAPNGLDEAQSDALCHAVWRRGVAASLSACCQALGLDPHVLMPQPPASTRHEHHGLSLQLVHPHAGEVAVGDPERWLIRHIQWSADADSGEWLHALPFGLDAVNETPASAALKLQAEGLGLNAAAMAEGDRRQSFFLEDGLVLELLWREGLTGLERVSAERLGSELQE